jgi:hypothetical protein
MQYLNLSVSYSVILQSCKNYSAYTASIEIWDVDYYLSIRRNMWRIGVLGECMYSSTHFLISALDRSDQLRAPATLAPEKGPWYPLDRGRVGPRML